MLFPKGKVKNDSMKVNTISMLLITGVIEQVSFIASLSEVCLPNSSHLKKKNRINHLPGLERSYAPNLIVYNQYS